MNTQQTQVQMHKSCKTNLHFCHSHMGIACESQHELKSIWDLFDGIALHHM